MEPFPARAVDSPYCMSLTEGKKDINVERKCVLGKGAARSFSSILPVTKQCLDGVNGKHVACMLLNVKPYILMFLFPSSTLTPVPPGILTCP